MNKIIFLLVFLVSVSSFSKNASEEYFEDFDDLAIAWEKEIEAKKNKILKKGPSITDSIAIQNYYFDFERKKMNKLIADLKKIARHEIRCDTSSTFRSDIEEFILKIKKIKRTKQSMAFNGVQIKIMFMLSDSDDLNGLQMAILPYLAMHIAWTDEKKFKPIRPAKNQNLAHKQ